jgi:hypothetical protein
MDRKIPLIIYRGKRYSDHGNMGFYLYDLPRMTGFKDEPAIKEYIDKWVAIEEAANG